MRKGARFPHLYAPDGVTTTGVEVDLIDGTVDITPNQTLTSTSFTGPITIVFDGSSETTTPLTQDGYNAIKMQLFLPIPTSITANPGNATVCAGSTASFSAAATGNPTPTAQWQVETNGGSTFSNLAGATLKDLMFTAAASQNGNQYRAMFSNVAGPATTSPATLTVDTPPAVTANPASQNVSPGSSVTFTAGASGSPAPTVQWQVSTNNGASFSDIAGATSASLTFTTTASQNGNQYRAVFTNFCSTATSTAATLTMKDFSVSITPTSETISIGQSAKYTVSVTPLRACCIHGRARCAES